MNNLRGHNNNPADNALGAGVTPTDLADAVRRSGYPLQTRISRQLHRHFTAVQEEWSYIDRDTGDLRALDIWAYRAFLMTGEGANALHTAVALLVECKQSELPYVFFRSSAAPSQDRFPTLAGLLSDHLNITSANRPGVNWEFPVAVALGLPRLPFGRDAYDHAISFAKLNRPGSRVELSGADIYSGVVLPLVKATDYQVESRRPVSRSSFLNCVAVLPVCVLDAPMVVAADDDLALVPWVRVRRRETGRPISGGRRTLDSFYTIDFVHASFVEEYVTRHVLPFGEHFGNKIAHHRNVLTSGQGIIDDFEEHRNAGDDLGSFLHS